MDSVSSGAALGDLQFCGDRKIDRREAGFLVARLVAHFERQTLPAQRGAAERLHFHSHRHAALIDIQLALGEFELAERALWIGDTHQAEACRKFGADFRGDQVLFRNFVRIDVKAFADLHHHGDFKRPAARHGLERNVRGRRHQRVRARHTYLAGSRRRRMSRQQHAASRPCHQQDRSWSVFEHHTVTGLPSCCVMIRLITCVNVSPVLGSTNAPAFSDQASLKLVASAEIQISRTGVLGEMTNFVSSGSSKRTSSFPLSPSTSKPC